MRRRFLIAFVIISILIIESLAFAITPKELIDKITARTKEIKDSYVDIRMSMSVTGVSQVPVRQQSLPIDLK